MPEITIPTRAVIDFNVYPKLGEALKLHINKINEGRLTPRYTSVAQLIIELLEREVKNFVNVPAPKLTSNNNDMPPEGFFD